MLSVKVILESTDLWNWKIFFKLTKQQKICFYNSHKFPPTSPAMLLVAIIIFLTHIAIFIMASHIYTCNSTGNSLEMSAHNFYPWLTIWVTRINNKIEMGQIWNVTFIKLAGSSLNVLLSQSSRGNYRDITQYDFPTKKPHMIANINLREQNIVNLNYLIEGAFIPCWTM